MKKVARLRFAASDDGFNAGGEQIGVRTTGRIKKPKAVYDPSDNYVSRSQRASIMAGQSNASVTPSSAAFERKRDSDGIQNKRLSQSSGQSTCTTVSPAQPAVPVDICTVCNKRESKRGLGARNKLVTCVDCDFRVHRMCLKMEFDDFDVLRSNFKCDDCRSCVLCSAFSEMEAGANNGELITCTKCVNSYHLNCHIPNIHKYQQITDWKCNKCTLPTIGTNGHLMAKEAIREIIGDESVFNAKTSSASDKNVSGNVSIAAAAEEAKSSAAAKRNFQALQNMKMKKIKGDNIQKKVDKGRDKDKEKEDEKKVTKKQMAKKQKCESALSSSTSSSSASSSSSSSSPLAARNDERRRSSPPNEVEIPDVKYWTVDQVVEFFKKYFPKEAYVFKEHEIDGMSLLLLKRSDVIKKLPIKLGPSLRIYSLILKIQTQLNDPTLGWNCNISLQP